MQWCSKVLTIFCSFLVCLSMNTESELRTHERLWIIDLSYPCLALLIALEHARTFGHDAFTFEYLFDLYSWVAKQSSSLNVSLEGVSVGLLEKYLLLPVYFHHNVCFHSGWIFGFRHMMTLLLYESFCHWDPYPQVPHTNTWNTIAKPRGEVCNVVEKHVNMQLQMWLQRPT